MLSKNWLPDSRSGKLALSRRWQNVLAESAGTWNIPADDVSSLRTLTDAADIALKKMQDKMTRTRVDTVACDKAFKALILEMRFIKNNYFNSPPRTVEDLTSVGLNPRNPPTPVPSPSTYPNIEIDTSVLRQLSVRFWDTGTIRRGKPQGVHGAEVRWDFSETQIVDPDALTHSEFNTKTPHTLFFSGDKRGKMVYICVRWQNAKGQKGPWGAIIGAVIP
ncbi:hypothetical protein FACS1894164_08500 [Spirochaetia bacterium]|nr:hypothetical protein FACS1894164_08500 [Spirochaetia bacterium]